MSTHSSEYMLQEVHTPVSTCSRKYMLQRTHAPVSCRSCCLVPWLWSLWHLTMGKTLLLLCRVAVSSTLRRRNGFSHSGQDIFFLLLNRRHAEGAVCKVTVAVFYTSSLLPYSVVCSSTAVGHGFVLAVCRSRHLCSIIMFSRLALNTNYGSLYR